MAGRGSGKSRLMGRAIAYDDFCSGVPLLIFDPMGSTIDNFLDKVLRDREFETQQLSRQSRILYIDMSGAGGSTVAFPIYYRLGAESLFDVASRFGDTIASLDPNLASAPIQGLNALTRASTYLGIILAAMNCQITELSALLQSSEAHLPGLQALAKMAPEVEEAVAFFNAIRSMPARERDPLLSSLEVKTIPLTLDPRQRAMFGADAPGIDWNDVTRRKCAVLLDFRGEHNAQLRRFKMLWVLSYFMAYVKARGRGRHSPISVIIDELTELVDIGSAVDSPFEKELNALVNVYARNCSLWLTICHQEAFQVRPYTYKTLMGMGTQVLGVTSDTASALQTAADMFAVDPYRVKAVESVWASRNVPDYVYDTAEGKLRMFMQTKHVPIDTRAHYLGIDEQHYLNASAVLNLGLFEFLIRVAKGEGNTSRRISAVHIKNLDKGTWVDEDRVAVLRERLCQQTGTPTDSILSSISDRQNALLVGREETVPHSDQPSAPQTLDDYDNWDASR